MTLPFHPLANLFPLLEGEDFDALVADIRLRGLRQAVTLFDGLIIDGRNRARACEAAGIDCRYETLPTDVDPIGFVISMNVPRRHLTDGQRAWVAAKLASIGWGGDRSKSPDGGLTTEQAAGRLNVAKRAVERARVVRDKAERELQDALERGQIPVSTAASLAELPREDQIEVLNGDANSISRRAMALIKRRHRESREHDLAKRQKALPTKKYGLIYVDIPRHFNVHSDETGLDRAPENHYPTLSFDETLRLPVGDLAADDCILVFWSTAASLIDDLEILAEWGFVTFRPRITNGKLVRKEDGSLADPIEGGRYCSMQVWDKVKMGLGYWFRDRHEFILVAARGNVVPPAAGTQDQSLFAEAKGRHSAKPDRVAAMIDRLWPNIPKIELFARRAREGWDCWGYEAPTIAESLGNSTPACDEPFDPNTGEIETTPAPTPAAPAKSEPKPEDDLSIPPFLLRVPKGEAVA